MPTNSSEKIVARSYIGESEDDDTFDERFDRHYLLLTSETDDVKRRETALHSAAAESLRARLAVMTVDDPSSASVQGQSYSNVQNIIGLKEQIKALDEMVLSSIGGAGRISRVKRVGRKR